MGYNTTDEDRGGKGGDTEQENMSIGGSTGSVGDSICIFPYTNDTALYSSGKHRQTEQRIQKN
jgi:hypothetical protein